MNRGAALLVLAIAGSGAGLLAASGCSSDGTVLLLGGAGAADATATTDVTASLDAGAAPDGTTAPTGAAPGDGASEGAPADDAGPLTVTSMAILSAYGTPLQAAAGDALPLLVQLTLSNGVTVNAGQTGVVWVAPATVVAQDPYDAGASVLPETGAQPTAFFVQNAWRGSKPGTLFVVDRGTGSSPEITVAATYLDAGVSATVTILPDRVGDAAAGGQLFQRALLCYGCHGPTAGGSPAETLPDGAVALADGGPLFLLWGQAYPYPAPGLNAAPDSGHLAADRAWTEGMFAVGAQADIDNHGVALRSPMPQWAGANLGNGHTLDAQDFADLYAWLLTQTQ